MEKRRLEKGKLLPCPFCGAEAFAWEWNYGARVDCSEWIATGKRTHFVGIGGENMEEAIRLWNTRKEGPKCKP